MIWSYRPVFCAVLTVECIIFKVFFGPKYVTIIWAILYKGYPWIRMIFFLYKTQFLASQNAIILIIKINILCRNFWVMLILQNNSTTSASILSNFCGDRLCALSDVISASDWRRLSPCASMCVLELLLPRRNNSWITFLS